MDVKFQQLRLCFLQLAAPPGGDGRVMSLLLAMEKLFGSMPPPPEIPACAGCAANVTNVMVWPLRLSFLLAVNFSQATRIPCGRHVCEHNIFTMHDYTTSAISDRFPVSSDTSLK